MSSVADTKVWGMRRSVPRHGFPQKWIMNEWLGKSNQSVTSLPPASSNKRLNPKRLKIST